MIELRINQTEAGKIQHSVTHAIKMIQAGKAAGIPFDGTLLTHGITHGTLVWTNEDGLDGPEFVLRWWDVNEDCTSETHGKREAHGSGPAYTWVRYANVDQQPTEDEL